MKHLASAAVASIVCRMSTNTATPPPDEDCLQQAALGYLARYAATEAGLRRVLIRQVDRWARGQPDPEAAKSGIAPARAAVEQVVARMVQSGALSDATFAESRARSLIRSGQSARSVQARLIAKGVAPDLARQATQRDDETELAAALVLVRKRRIGAYRSLEAVDAVVQTKELGLLARAGYSREIAEQALGMSREEAEARIFELRR
jgi:regulatory protein